MVKVGGVGVWGPASWFVCCRGTNSAASARRRETAATAGEKTGALGLSPGVCGGRGVGLAGADCTLSRSIPPVPGKAGCWAWLRAWTVLRAAANARPASIVMTPPRFGSGAEEDAARA